MRLPRLCQVSQETLRRIARGQYSDPSLCEHRASTCFVANSLHYRRFSRARDSWFGADRGEVPEIGTNADAVPNLLDGPRVALLQIPGAFRRIRIGSVLPADAAGAYPAASLSLRRSRQLHV